jgi:hypothetical protein
MGEILRALPDVVALCVLLSLLFSQKGKGWIGCLIRQRKSRPKHKTMAGLNLAFSEIMMSDSKCEAFYNTLCALAYANSDRRACSVLRLSASLGSIASQARL